MSTIDLTAGSNIDIKRTKKLGGSNLVTFKLFDLYQESEKNQDSSYAFNFTWQSNKKTLEDKEIDLIVSDIIKGFREKFNAKLRS